MVVELNDQQGFGLPVQTVVLLNPQVTPVLVPALVTVAESVAF